MESWKLKPMKYLTPNPNMKRNSIPETTKTNKQTNKMHKIRKTALTVNPRCLELLKSDDIGWFLGLDLFHWRQNLSNPLTSQRNRQFPPVVVVVVVEKELRWRRRGGDSAMEIGARLPGRNSGRETGRCRHWLFLFFPRKKEKRGKLNKKEESIIFKLQLC